MVGRDKKMERSECSDRYPIQQYDGQTYRHMFAVQASLILGQLLRF